MIQRADAILFSTCPHCRCFEIQLLDEDGEVFGLARLPAEAAGEIAVQLIEIEYVVMKGRIDRLSCDCVVAGHG
jgi:hypothetical protein